MPVCGSRDGVLDQHDLYKKIQHPRNSTVTNTYGKSGPHQDDEEDDDVSEIHPIHEHGDNDVALDDSILPRFILE